MSPETLPIVKSIQRTLTGLVIATVVLWLVVLVGGGLIVSSVSTTADTANYNARATARLSVQNHASQVQTHSALCTFRADLGKRIATTQDYLAKHPEPIILGVPRETFVKSVVDQQRTYYTLAGLGC